MRKSFIKALTDLASRDERIFLLTADLGFGVFEEFARRFPTRFVNTGVAEQNMTGVAAGLALSNKIVFTYSIGNFPTIRCVEQIRNDVCYHELNVNVVCVGGGFAYGALGLSHHATEDLGVMRCLPNMTVVAPGDPVEAALATKAVYEIAGPCYLRLGRAGEIVVHASPPRFKIGKAITLQDGKDITLIATGGMLPTVLKAAALLKQEGISARVLSMHTVKPLDAESVLAAAHDTGKIVTVEEHSVIGGLGSSVAEVLAEAAGRQVVLKRMGVSDGFCHEVGNQEHLRKVYGLSVEGIVSESKKMMHSDYCARTEK